MAEDLEKDQQIADEVLDLWATGFEMTLSEGRINSRTGEKFAGMSTGADGRWLSFEELMERWSCVPFEVLDAYMNGLMPVNTLTGEKFPDMAGFLTGSPGMEFLSDKKRRKILLDTFFNKRCSRFISWRLSEVEAYENRYQEFTADPVAERRKVIAILERLTPRRNHPADAQKIKFLKSRMDGKSHFEARKEAGYYKSCNTSRTQLDALKIVKEQAGEDAMNFIKSKLPAHT